MAPGSLACASMGRRVDVTQLVGASDIRDRLGLVRVQDVHGYRRRDASFPEPVASIGGGPKYGILVWYWPDVAAWARRKGITPKDASVPSKVRPTRRSRDAELDAELARVREERTELAELRQQLGDIAELREAIDALHALRPKPDAGGPTERAASEA